MNVIVDIYYDNNLGDDILGEMLINLLQGRGIICYTRVNDFLTAPVYLNRLNVKFIDEINRESIKKNNINVYIKIGGSMFPHGTIREGLQKYEMLQDIKMLKHNNVKICILNCNTGPINVKLCLGVTKKILQSADLLTCRDLDTFKELPPKVIKRAYCYPDLVFSHCCFNEPKIERKFLGISVFSGYAPYQRKYNFQYGKFLVNLINKYHEKKSDLEVKLFVFDTGYMNDFPVTYYIYNHVSFPQKVHIIPYHSDIDGFMKEFNSCKAMIGTRFHSIVLALLCKIPVMPIVYSNKTQNLLHDIGYNGSSLNIKDCPNVNFDIMIDSLEHGTRLLNSVEEKYKSQSNAHFERLIELLNEI